MAVKDQLHRGSWHEVARCPELELRALEDDGAHASGGVVHDGHVPCVPDRGRGALRLRGRGEGRLVV